MPKIIKNIVITYFFSYKSEFMNNSNLEKLRNIKIPTDKYKKIVNLTSYFPILFTRKIINTIPIIIIVISYISDKKLELENILNQKLVNEASIPPFEEVDLLKILSKKCEKDPMNSKNNTNNRRGVIIL